MDIMENRYSTARPIESDAVIDISDDTYKQTSANGGSLYELSGSETSEDDHANAHDKTLASP